MTIEQAFKKIFLELGYDIERVANSDYLYEVEINKKHNILTEEEVIRLAETL